MNLHLNQAKYGEIATDLLQEDSEIEVDVQSAIQNKDLKQTLTLVSRKAATKQSKMHFSDKETIELAFEVFVQIFEKMDMTDDVKQKMAATVNKKLQESIQPPAAPPMAPSSGKGNQVPTAEGELYLHINRQKYGSIALDIVKADSRFAKQIEKAINEKDLKLTLTNLAQKANSKKRDLAFSDREAMELAFELFSVIFTPMNMSRDLKEKMAETVKQKLLEAVVPETPSDASTEPAMTANVPSSRPKIFTSKSLGNESSTPTSRATPSEASASTSESASDDALRQQRELLRRSHQGFKESAGSPAVKDASIPAVTLPTGEVSINPIEKIDQWLRSDSKLMKIVEKIEQTGSDGLRVVFDPESEGILPNIDIRFQARRYGDVNIIKLDCTSQARKKYPLCLAIGNNGKRFVVGALLEGIPENEDDAVRALIDVNLKNQMEWDRLQVLLFNDKEVIDKVKRLALRNPAPKVDEEIRVPVYVKNDIPGARILLSTFLSVGLKPSFVFLEIMEKIADDIDQVGSSGGDDYSGGSVSSALSRISTSQTQDMHGHQFHFLAKDEQVTLKTCPYCGRPYPNPQADYRRCPNCLAKLK